MEEYDLELTKRVMEYAEELGSALTGIADAEILKRAFARRTVFPAVVRLWCSRSIFRMVRWKSCGAEK